jgi:hypothetical protein
VNQYEVDWTPAATAALAAGWMQAPDRRALTVAQTRIDQLLTQNPAGAGVHRSEGLYRLEVPPLTVLYSIDENAKAVEVSDVWFTF